MPHKLCWAPEGIPAKKPAGRYQLEWPCKQSCTSLFHTSNTRMKKNSKLKKKSHIETALTWPTEGPCNAKRFKERSHQLGWAPFLGVHLISNRMMPEFVPFLLHTHCQVAGKQRGATNNHLKKGWTSYPFVVHFFSKASKHLSSPQHAAAACPKLSAGSLSSLCSTMPSPPEQIIWALLLRSCWWQAAASGYL